MPNLHEDFANVFCTVVFYRSIVLGKIDSKAKDVEVSEGFVSNIHHALRAVTMPTAERDIGNFLTDPIVSEATSDGGDGEGDELDEDGGDEDKESYLEVANDHRLARDVLKKA